MSDIDTVVVDSLKALDPKRPIREADILKTMQSPSRLFSEDESERPSTQASACSLAVIAQPRKPWIWFSRSTTKQ